MLRARGPLPGSADTPAPPPELKVSFCTRLIQNTTGWWIDVGCSPAGLRQHTSLQHEGVEGGLTGVFVLRGRCVDFGTMPVVDREKRQRVLPQRRCAPTAVMSWLHAQTSTGQPSPE